MKRMMALLMVLVMAFGCTGAMAETDISNGFSMEMKLNVNKDLATAIVALMMGTESINPAQASALLDVVNLSCIHMDTDGKNVNIVANLNEQPVASLQGTVGENSVVLATDVLPSYAFEVMKEDMQMNGMDSIQMDAIDPAAMQQAEKEFEEALTNVLNNALASVNATVIAQEACELPYSEEITFNYVTVVSVPAADMLKALCAASGQIVDALDAFLQKIGVQLPEEVNMEELKAEIAAMEIPEEAANTIIYISDYVIMEGETQKEGYAYSLIEIGDGVDMVYVGVTQLDKMAEIFVYAGSANETAEQIYQNALTGASDAFVIELAAMEGETEDHAQAAFTLITSGLMIGADMLAQPNAAGGNDMQVDFYFLTEEAPVATLLCSVLPLEGEVPAADTTGKTVLTADMLEGEGAENVEQAMNLELQQSLNALLVKAIQAAPAEMQALMDSLTPAVEEIPAAE